MTSYQRPKLPPVPTGRVGWPWDPDLLDNPVRDFLDLEDLPRISIVTPSFNQGEFVEQTIRSVLLQGYPKLEYIVMDGGSSDQTLEVLEKYAPFLDYWVSEEDAGQTDAINRGLERATGNVLAYINSDDYYQPGALLEVGRQFAQNASVTLVQGACGFVDQYGSPLRRHLGRMESVADALDLWRVWWRGRQWIQPEVFWSRRVWEVVGPFNEDLTIAFDFDYWIRVFNAGFTAHRLDRELACFRIQPHQKTSDAKAVAGQELDVVARYLWSPDLKWWGWRRWRLQGDLLYQREWLEKNSEELAAKTRLGRWCSALWLLFRKPKVLLSSKFRDRLLKAATPKLGEDQ